MELTQKEYHNLCVDIAKAVLRALDKSKKLSTDEEWIPSKEAASILHISVSHLYRIKSRFPHMKSGDNERGHLLFLKSGLVSNYAQ